MKGYYDRPYKKAPTVLRVSLPDPWDSSDLVIPSGFASQSGVSPRGCSVVQRRMQGDQLGGLLLRT